MKYRLKALLLLVVMHWVMPVGAHEHVFADDIKHEISLSFDRDLLAQCMQYVVNPEACVGAMREQCRNSPLVHSEELSGYCAELELKEWDQLLNGAYGRLLSKLKTYDQMDGRVEDLVHTSRVGNLRNMQRAWIDYRDDKCDFVRAITGTHLAAAIAYIECQAEETARQYLYLNSWLRLQL